MANSEASKDDRSLPASERRLQKAADEGQVARSRDLGHSAMLGAFLLATLWLGSGLFDTSTRILSDGLNFNPQLLSDPTLVLEHVSQLALRALGGVTPFLALLAVAAIIVSVVPGGFVLTLKPLMPDFKRVSVLAGLGRLFNRDILVDLGKLILFAGLLSMAGGWYTWSSIPSFAQLASTHIKQALNLSFATIQNGLWLLFVLMVMVTILDVLLQRHRHQSNLKMTLQEVRDEHKETDGDPQIKSRIRGRQQQISRARMLSELPKADVIITNPSHFAVAIRYDETGMGAPTVIAKGADHLAARIREIAGFCEIPFVEAPPLARALYAHVEVGHEIPAALYQAVAQVLAYVYQLRHWQPGQGAHPSVPHELAVPMGLDPLGANR
jgi:flagellar biosynthesis protein FlhB